MFAHIKMTNLIITNFLFPVGRYPTGYRTILTRSYPGWRRPAVTIPSCLKLLRLATVRMNLRMNLFVGMLGYAHWPGTPDCRHI